MDGIAIYMEHREEVLFEMSGEYFDDIIPENDIPFHFDGWGRCVDDVSGAELPMELVRKGREAEIECFSERKVYAIRPRQEAMTNGAKALGVRWVDVWKNGKVRSRLVCQDFNTDKGKRCDEMFAATPPLFVSRWLTSLAASQGTEGPGRMQLMALDLSKAFLYGDVQRITFRGFGGTVIKEHVRAQGRTSSLAEGGRVHVARARLPEDHVHPVHLFPARPGDVRSGPCRRFPDSWRAI